MTSDFGVRRSQTFGGVPRPILISALIGAAGFLVWNLTSNYLKVVHGRIADAAAWKIDGPPCPRITKADFLARRYHMGPRKFDYEGVTFFRRYGHVSCAPIYYDAGRSDRFYPVCQFTSPGQLLIRTRKGDWYFEPGLGKGVTISAPHDEAHCVMASNFTLSNARRAQ